MKMMMNHGKFKAGAMGQNQLPRTSVQMQAEKTSPYIQRDSAGLDKDGKPDLKTGEGKEILEKFQKLGELIDSVADTALEQSNTPTKEKVNKNVGV